MSRPHVHREQTPVSLPSKYPSTTTPSPFSAWKTSLTMRLLFLLAFLASWAHGKVLSLTLFHCKLEIFVEKISHRRRKDKSKMFLRSETETNSPHCLETNNPQLHLHHDIYETRDFVIATVQIYKTEQVHPQKRSSKLIKRNLEFLVLLLFPLFILFVWFFKDIQYSRQKKEGRRGSVQLVAPPCSAAVNVC